VLRSRPAIGLVILVLSAVVWRLGRLPGAAAGGGSQDRRLLLITVTIVGISAVAAVLSLLGHGSPLR
jgi:hypothetical protein